MRNDYVFILKLVSLEGEIQGRTRIQKTCHILKELGYPIRSDFKWANYGMFSQELQDKIYNLVESGILKEDDHRIGDMIEYHYSEGVSFPRDQSESDLVHTPDLFTVARELLHFDLENLELWSSIFYLMNREDTDEDLINFLHYLKPKFSKERIRKGIEEVQALKERLGATP